MWQDDASLGRPLIGLGHCVDDWVHRAAQAVWRALLAHDPLWATSVGERAWDDRLPDPTPLADAALTARLSTLGLELRRGRRVWSDRLAVGSGRWLACETVEHRIAAAHQVPVHRWSVDHLNGPQAKLAQLPRHHHLRHELDARNLLTRYRAIPSYLRAHTDTLLAESRQGRIAARVAIKRVVAQIRKQIGTAADHTPYLQHLDWSPGVWSTAWKGQLSRAVVDAVLPALGAYADTLEASIEPRARSDAEIGLCHLGGGGGGADSYLAVLHAFCGLDARSPRDPALPLALHEWGLRECQRLRPLLALAINDSLPTASVLATSTTRPVRRGVTKGPNTTTGTRATGSKDAAELERHRALALGPGTTGTRATGSKDAAELERHRRPGTTTGTRATESKDAAALERHRGPGTTTATRATESKDAAALERHRALALGPGTTGTRATRSKDAAELERHRRPGTTTATRATESKDAAALERTTRGTRATGSKDAAELERHRALALGPGTTGTRATRSKDAAELERHRRPGTTRGTRATGSKDAAELERHRALVQRATIGARSAFDRLPKTLLEVAAVPWYLASDAPGGYYEAASSPREPGRYLFNAETETDPTKPDCAAVLAFHEAIPGHHLQIALTLENPALHPIQQHCGQTAFIEGWAVYAEQQLATELGLYHTDAEQFGALVYDMWRAVRLVVDTGVHWFGWSRTRASQTMQKWLEGVSSQDDRDTELDRYIVNPGQAVAYKVGQREICRLRDRCRAQWGSAFTLARFHRRILAHGAPPWNLLVPALLASRPCHTD